jgi:hypothetical protein
MGSLTKSAVRLVSPLPLWVAACLVSGATLAASVAVNQVITVQPIDVCVVNQGPHGEQATSCAPFNTHLGNPSPTTQNSTTNPIGFVYSYVEPTTNQTRYIDVTRALLNQMGVDVQWKPMVQYVSPVIDTSTGQTYQTLNTVENNSACGFPPGSPQTGLQSCDLLKLSQQPCIAETPNPVCNILPPLSPVPSVVNMFFVNSLNPPPRQAGSQLNGFSWLNNNGIAIGSNTFFPPAPLTPLVDVLAHELLHNAGLDHTHWGAGPYNPISVDPDGGALQGTPPGVMVGECDAGYPACMANLLTIGKLRTVPTVDCVAVANPPLPGQTPCPEDAPSLATGDADQLTLISEEWAGLPQSQQGQVTDPTGLLQPIPNSTTTVRVPQNSNSMIVTVTGARDGGRGDTLLAWVFLASGALQFDSRFRSSPSALLQDADWPHPDRDNNTTNGVYNIGKLYDVCAAPNAQCLIVEFKLPGIGPNTTIEFSKGFTTPITNASLCGAKIASIFGHGYMTISQLACPNNVAPSVLTASSWSPDLTAPVPPQIVNEAAFEAAASGNPPCRPVNGACPNPVITGVTDANPAEEPQVCYFQGSPIRCP